MCCSADQRHDLQFAYPRPRGRRLGDYLPFSWLLLAVLLLPTPAARAQSGALTVVPSAATISITLSCPTPAPALLITVDGLPVAPLDLPSPASQSAEQRSAAALAPAATLHFSLPAAALAPGPHQLAVSGCGAPLEVPFTMPARPAPLWPLALILAASIGAGWAAAHIRPRRPPPATTASAAQTVAPAEITTVRRPLTPSEPGRLRAVIWDGRSRRVFALHGRQWSLGADAGCDLWVADAGLAPLHARLSLVGEQIEVTALEDRTFHTGLGCALTIDQATPLGEGEALLLGASVRLTIETS